MRAPIVLLADYANVEQSGKLNVMGIFGVIHARDFPLVHALMHLVVKLVPEIGERGGKRQLTVRIVDEDGTQIWELSASIEVLGSKGGSPRESNYIFALGLMEFPKAGGYTFLVLVDDIEVGRVDIEVVKMRQQGG